MFKYNIYKEADNSKLDAIEAVLPAGKLKMVLKA